MYYSYFTRNGIEYASTARSVREGKRVMTGERVYFGRFVDKDCACSGAGSAASSATTTRPGSSSTRRGATTSGPSPARTRGRV